MWTAKTVKRPPQQPAQPPIRQLLGAADAQNDTPRHIQHSPGTPTTGLRERGNNTSRSTDRSGPQKAATRRNMRREEREELSRAPLRNNNPTECHTGGAALSIALGIWGGAALDLTEISSGWTCLFDTFPHPHTIAFVVVLSRCPGPVQSDPSPHRTVLWVTYSPPSVPGPKDLAAGHVPLLSCVGSCSVGTSFQGDLRTEAETFSVRSIFTLCWVGGNGIWGFGFVCRLLPLDLKRFRWICAGLSGANRDNSLGGGGSGRSHKGPVIQTWLSLSQILGQDFWVGLRAKSPPPRPLINKACHGHSRSTENMLCRGLEGG